MLCFQDIFFTLVHAIKSKTKSALLSWCALPRRVSRRTPKLDTCMLRENMHDSMLAMQGTSTSSGMQNVSTSNVREVIYTMDRHQLPLLLGQQKAQLYNRNKVDRKEGTTEKKRETDQWPMACRATLKGLHRKPRHRDCHDSWFWRQDASLPLPLPHHAIWLWVVGTRHALGDSLRSQELSEFSTRKLWTTLRPEFCKRGAAAMIFMS